MTLKTFLNFFNYLNDIKKDYYKKSPLIVKITTPILLINFIVTFTLMMIDITKIIIKNYNKKED